MKLINTFKLLLVFVISVTITNKTIGQSDIEMTDKSITIEVGSSTATLNSDGIYSRLLMERPLLYNSISHSHEGVNLNNFGQLILSSYAAENNSLFGADNNDISSLTFPESWEMIKLNFMDFDETGPFQRHTWNIGLMSLVTFVNPSPDESCIDCLTFTFDKANVGNRIKRIINNNGEDFYVSDERYKKNISDVTNALSIVGELKPKKYKFKSDSSSDKFHFGLMAQEVKKILPELVVKVQQPESKEESYLMNYDGLTPILLKAIQEQQALIESLQNRIASLESK